MPLHIVRNDITLMRVDAIVNSANHNLSGGGGADGAIHRAAGPGLAAECRTLGGCKTGEVKVTRGYNLPCRYVLHTVAPVWCGGLFGEKEILAACYRRALKVAKRIGVESIAFPLLSTGVFGYPRKKALDVAVETISRFLQDYEMTVYIVVYDNESFRISNRLFGGVRRYIDDHYVASHAELDDFCYKAFSEDWDSDSAFEETSEDTDADSAFEDSFSASFSVGPWGGNAWDDADFACTIPPPAAAAPADTYAKAEKPAVKPKKDSIAKKELDYSESTRRLQAAFRMIDESFSQMVLRLIDARGMKDPECYKRANMDRKLFSKIRNDIHYKPKKTTAVALAVALRLSRAEADELLRKAGYALSRSSKFDIIIEYCFNEEIYDIHQVNRILFDFDQPLLGA